MKLITQKLILRRLGGATLSAVLTAVFMYLLVYRGLVSIYAGLCIGFFIYLIINLYNYFVEKRYVRKLNLLLIMLINVTVQVLVIFMVAFFFVWYFYLGSNLEIVYLNFNYLLKSWFLYGIIFGLLASFMFNVYEIISTLVGPHILRKLLFGFYKNPRETNRLFMFLDIRSSTTIAEKIGPSKFMSMVDDFFFDIAEPVQKTRGEIYKYVGDEVIITWKMNEGLKNAHAAQCFFLLEDLIETRRTYYLKKYGVVPEFKAGLHGGKVITGQLGYVKREIAYMGDVLNTTARIEEACKTFGKKLLASGDVMELMKLPSGIMKTQVGNVKLRGKENELSLFALDREIGEG